MQEGGIRALRGDEIEQVGDVCIRDVMETAVDPHQRADGFAQREGRVVGELQDCLHAVCIRRDDHAAQQPVGGHGDGEGSVGEQMVHRRGGGFESFDGEHRGAPARTCTADSLGCRRCQQGHLVAFQLMR